MIPFKTIDYKKTVIPKQSARIISKLSSTQFQFSQILLALQSKIISHIKWGISQLLINSCAYDINLNHHPNLLDILFSLLEYSGETEEFSVLQILTIIQNISFCSPNEQEIASNIQWKNLLLDTILDHKNVQPKLLNCTIQIICKLSPCLELAQEDQPILKLYADMFFEVLSTHYCTVYEKIDTDDEILECCLETINGFAQSNPGLVLDMLLDKKELLGDIMKLFSHSDINIRKYALKLTHFLSAKNLKTKTLIGSHQFAIEKLINIIYTFGTEGDPNLDMSIASGYILSNLSAAPGNHQNIWNHEQKLILILSLENVSKKVSALIEEILLELSQVIPIM